MDMNMNMEFEFGKEGGSEEKQQPRELESERPPNPLGSSAVKQALRSSGDGGNCIGRSAPPLVRHASLMSMGQLKHKESVTTDFVPVLRPGIWADIGGRKNMEDAYACIGDLAKQFDHASIGEGAVSFYGVFDGHGGKDAAHFVRDNLPKLIAESCDFPLELEKAVGKSFIETDNAFAKACLLEGCLSSGTTALVAMICGRSLLVANAGDCRAVLSRRGRAVEMSRDHRPSCAREKKRIEALGGYIVDGYLNGQLNVSRALGDWHLEGLKDASVFGGGPLSAEPEMKKTTLLKEDEFIIIGSDGLWEVFTSQNAVDFARRRLQEHNDPEVCCKELIDEALKRKSADNLTVVTVCFNSEPPPSIGINKSPVQRSISAEGLRSLQYYLDSLRE